MLNDTDAPVLIAAAPPESGAAPHKGSAAVGAAKPGSYAGLTSPQASTAHLSLPV